MGGRNPGRRTIKQVSVQDDEVRNLAGFDRAAEVLLAAEEGSIDRVGGQHRREVDPLLGDPGRRVRDARFNPGYSNLNGLERIHRGDRPIGAAGHNGAGPDDAPDRVEPARAGRAENRQGQVRDVAIGPGP
ncbi:MAG: hypothetical protein MUQ00_14690 [Candidatus Aminicenantes bacterium]|nr:hypothetical protein [Candidatus Aminicenantes bacterium]